MIDPFDNPEDCKNEKLRKKRQSFTESKISAYGLYSPAINIGETGWAEELSELAGCKIECTTQDIDFADLPEGKYGAILCFEVLEHVGNPLHLLYTMQQALKENGRIWLSTPLVRSWRPKFFRNKKHVNEFDRAQLEYLIYKAGLVEMKRWEFLYQPWWTYFNGVRPLVRLFSDRCCMMILKRRLSDD